MKFFVLIAALVCLWAGAASAATPISAQLSVNVVPAATTNCPTTPPPQAVAAGYTTLAYCIDPATPKYQNIPGWVDCGNTQQLGFELYLANHDSAWSCANNLHIVTDATTGKTVLDWRFNANTDPPLDKACGCTIVYMPFPYPEPNSSYGTFPQGAYTEIRFRDVPFETIFGHYAFDFFYWGNAVNIHNQGPIERDIIEDNGPQHNAGGTMHDWSNGGKGTGTSPVIPAVEHLVANADQNGVQDMHTYGWLTTSDGVSLQQECGYIDNALAVAASMPYGATNCHQVQDYRPNKSPCYTFPNAATAPYPCQQDETYHLVMRQYLNWWFPPAFGLQTYNCQHNAACVAAGGQPDNDVYMEYMAIWTCANRQTDPTCVGNGISPHAVTDVTFNGATTDALLSTASFTAPSVAGTVLGTLAPVCSDGPCSGSASYKFYAAPQGDCNFPTADRSEHGGADNGSFTLSGNQLLTKGGLTANGGAFNGNYSVCVMATVPGYTPQVRQYIITGK